MFLASGFSRVTEFVSRLLSGGTLEIVLLIILIVVALILFLVALWIIWKLLVLLGKGLLWLFGAGAKTAREQSASRREARLAKPPFVATGWSSSARLRLGRALSEARRFAGGDALRIVLISGGNMTDLCKGLGVTPPGVGTVGIGAGGDTILVDASEADGSALRRLSQALPWRRPADGLAITVTSAGIPSDALARATRFARMAGMRMAVHFVLPSTSKTPVWRIIDGSESGDDVTSQLAVDAARIWLSGGSREGLADLAQARSRELPSTLDRAMTSTSSSVLDIASLSIGGPGLQSAVAQTVERTKPTTTPGLKTWVGVGVLAAGVALTGLVALAGFDNVLQLRSVAQTAAREAGGPQAVAGISVQPGPAQVRRISGLGVRLARFLEFSPLMPLAPLAPNFGAPRELGALLLEQRVLRPLGTALDMRARRLLEPENDPRAWLEQAQLVDEILVAWQGLGDEPSEVDLRRLFSVGFGSSEDAWFDGTEVALEKVRAHPPPYSEGGLDTDGLTALARQNLISTMRLWAETTYTNGPVAQAARLAGDRSLSWETQHATLRDLRSALQNPANAWLTSAEDQPDYRFEIEVLGKALGLSLLGQTAAIEARSEVSRIRLAARKAATTFTLPDLGQLMVRSGAASSSEGALSLAPTAAAWLGFLDRIDKAGFVSDPVAPSAPIAGPVTLEREEIAKIRNRLRVFELFAANLPTDLPALAVQGLILELANELTVGVTTGVENGLRSANTLGTALNRAQILASVAPSLDDLTAIEDWLRQRYATAEADRVSAVHSRVAQTVLGTATEVLEVEDPLGVWPDPDADRGALARRAARGFARMNSIYENLAAPFIQAASLGEDSWNTVQWLAMEKDMAGYQRGDGDAALSRFETLVQTYADSGDDGACESLGRTPEGRDDYIARAYRRFHGAIEQACGTTEARASEQAIDQVAEYFVNQVAWLWPYTSDLGAPELSQSTLADFLGRIREAENELAALSTDDKFALFLMDNARFWTIGDDQQVSVSFRLAWRVRPNEENLAENIVSLEVIGPEVDEDGIYTWRYGSPFMIRMSLAQNSAYRIIEAVDDANREWVITASGNGPLLRVLSGKNTAALLFETQVVDEQGNIRPLRVSARLSRPDESAITMPDFALGEALAKNRE